MIIVCGLSGSGKTTFVQKANLGWPELRHVIASEVLRGKGCNVFQPNLNEAIRNQEVLAKWLGLSDSNFIFDGHLMIETTTGPFLIPDTTFDLSRLQRIIFVKRDSNAVAQARESQALGLSTKIEDISELYEIEKCHSRRLAARAGASFNEINLDEEPARTLIF